jgi:hypothetical protein
MLPLVPQMGAFADFPRINKLQHFGGTYAGGVFCSW